MPPGFPSTSKLLPTSRPPASRVDRDARPPGIAKTAGRSPHARLSAICLCVLGVFLYVTYHRGEDSTVRIFDNLDLIISWYQVLRDSGTFWAPLHSAVPQIFGGLPRNSMVSSLSVVPALFMFLDPLPAYILAEPGRGAWIEDQPD